MAAQPSFIPAKESALFTKVFGSYTNILFRRRFDERHINIRYSPAPDRKTIYFMNHHSWWDGMIPLYLNHNYFHQNARGMMEGKQLRKHSFFSKIGVFSIDLDDPRSIMRSLRYAVDSMERPFSSLYIFPQGKIEPFMPDRFEFKKGLGWLAKKVPEADLVPIGIYIHTMRSDKPELHITVGNSIHVDRTLTADEISGVLQNGLSTLLREVVESTIQKP